MRVIAGEAKGRTLIAPRGSATRPASDRIRETLFAILEPRLAGASVLDLFAGAGTLGIEALSRGAAHATFVERAAAAAAAIRANLAATRLEDRAEVVVADVLRYLGGTAASSRDEQAVPRSPRAGGFDVVFCDAPFADVAGAEACLAHPGLRAARAPGARVIVRALRKHLPALPPGATVARRRELGEETLLFLGYDDAARGG